MRLEPVGVEVRTAAGTDRVAWDGTAGEVACGGVTVAVDGVGGRWAVANPGADGIALRGIALVFAVVGASGPLRMLVNGYQSWSPTGVLTLGRDIDPSRRSEVIEAVRDIYGADPDPVGDGELRSEFVTLVGDGDDLHLVGFAAGTSHDGLLRLRPGAPAELVCEAYLGDAVLPAGERRPLHAVVTATGDEGPAMLDRWATDVGRDGQARISAPYQVGWCSWYHYFHDVTEDAVRANLALAGDWPFDVFQVDDGFQPHIGDWLQTNERFPSGHEALAADIAAAGYVPGIWLAPFIAHPESDAARAAPGLFAGSRDRDDPLLGGFNPEWGGIVHALDTTRPETLAHIDAVARGLVERGYRYLKLDFTYAPGMRGVFSDETRTPAERVRAGYEAVRRGAGDDVFLLGCGAPLGPVVGIVDGNRIGPDVAPFWGAREQPFVSPAYDETSPATENAWRSTLVRSFMHRRLWLNDPDCLMLRTDHTELSPEAAGAWALAVGVSGGMALVSDDLALLDGHARVLLDEVLALGRDSDDRARTGPAPRCDDVMERRIPTRLTSASVALAADLDGPTATVTTHRAG